MAPVLKIPSFHPWHPVELHTGCALTPVAEQLFFHGVSLTSTVNNVVSLEFGIWVICRLSQMRCLEPFLLLFFCFFFTWPHKKRSTSAVYGGNAAKLFCCEAPEMFFVLYKTSLVFPPDTDVSRYWLKFHLWLNLPFSTAHDIVWLVRYLNA